MKSWEDIMKEKLEGYEAKLPENSLADFRSRLAESHQPAKKAPKRFATYAAAVAIAACVALAVLTPVLKHDATTDDKPLLADTEQSHESAERLAPPTAPDLAQASMAKPMVGNALSASAKPYAAPSTTTNASEKQAADSNVPTSGEKNQHDESANAPTADVNHDTEVVTNEAEPSAPLLAVADNEQHKRSSRSKIGLATGSALGAGLVGGLVSSLGLMGSTDDMASGPAYDPGTGGGSGSDTPKDELVGNPKHSMPLKSGLSVRWALSDRLSLTSGLEYTMYSSTYTYSLSGEKKQRAHYLGIPVRVDYSFVQSRWVNIYAGAGGTVDFCLAATLDGAKIKKDGINTSLQGVGGVQFNLTKHLGAYVEPQISWAIPSSNQVIDTYRTEHPVSFNISAGIRLTIGK